MQNTRPRTPLYLATRRISTLCAGIAMASAVPAMAQLEEVIVTAQHRAENVQEIPIAVTALNAELLHRADIFDIGSIAQNTPGLSYAEFSPGQASVTMRGIGSADDGAGLDNSVAMFLDGVYIGRGASINFDMFDLERIEVLRGPQGTLFGRNAIGGAISVVTTKPADEFGAKLGATAGNEGILRYQGMVTGPLAESLSGKITFNHREHDGFVENVITGKDEMDEDQDSIRGQLRWDLDNSEWLLSADYMEDDRADMGRTPFVDNAPLSDILVANGVNSPWKNASARTGFSKREASGISLQGDFDFDNGTLTSITAFRHAETDWEMASAGAPLGGLGLPFDEVIDAIVEDIDTFSQEFRWTSSLGDKFNYTLGLYYFEEDTDRVEQFKISAAGSYEGAHPFTLTDVGSQDFIGNEYSRTANETTSYAVYGQGTYSLNDKWSLTAGGRFTLDEKDYTAESVNCGADRTGTDFENFPECEGLGGSLNIIAESFLVEPSDDWDDFSPMIAVKYFASDSVMWYGSVSRGFKSGGFAGSQGVESVASNPVDPETATNFELGFKGDMLDDTLRLNATAFYTDYEDLQVVRFGPVPGSEFGTFITTNLGSAEIAGVEVEFTWYITEEFRLSGFYAYLDTEVDDLLIETAGGLTDASGKDLIRAPENSGNLALDYDTTTSIGDINVRLSYSHSDEQRTDYVDDRIIQDEQDLWDGRIGWMSSDESWEVAAWVKNMTDEDYVSHMYVIGPGGIGIWGPPRTYGISLNWKM
jgi:iron complex outermembrane receptor protein